MRRASKIAIPMCSLAMAVSAYAANTNTPPTADFSISIDGNYIKVKSKATDADGDVLKHKWSFGDKASSVAVNPGHAYAVEGIYSIRLKVSDGKASAVKTQEITIPNNPPVSDFEIASRNQLKLKFKSKASDPESDAVKVKWNFGDGKTSTALNPGHTYAEAGTYTVTLSVNDGYHPTVKKSMKVTVKDYNHSPEAGFSVTRPKSNKLYVKAISNASDADNDPLKYQWNFGDGTSSTAENPGHTYTAPGNYTITQKISDGASSATYTKTVIVRKIYTADFDVAHDGIDPNPLAISVIPFDYGTFSDLPSPADCPILGLDNDLQYRWSFGDDTFSQEICPQHVYSKPGTYDITLTVNHGELPMATQTKTITVENPDDPVVDNERLAMQVIGYLVSVPVCVSIDNETCLEGDEYVSYTDNNGKVSFNKEVLKSLFKTHDKIKLIAVAPKDTKSIVAGTEVLSTKDVVLTRTLFSEDLDSANANDSDIALITPFSTLADMTNPQSKEEYTSSVYQIGEVYDDNSQVDLLSVDYNYDMNKWLIISEFLGRLGFLPSSFASLKEKNSSNLTIDQIKENIRGIRKFVDYLLDNDVSGTTAEVIELTHESLGQSFKKLASGTAEEWRCGITHTNNAYCWGLAVDWCTLGNHEYCASHDSVWDPYNPLRGADQHMYSYKPVPVEHEVPCNDNNSEICYENLQGVIDLSFSYRSACAVTIDGYVYCWGENFDGEGGQGEPIKADGSNTRLEVAKKVVNTADRQYENPYLNNIKQVIHGQKFACALSNEGEVFCWGINGSQQLGGTYDNLVLETTWQSADNNASLGDVDEFGKPIIDARRYSPTPIQVRFPEEVKIVNKLFAGRNVACVTVERNDNDPHNVYCWGNDSEGLISNGADRLESYHRKSYDEGYYYPSSPELGSGNYYEIIEEGVNKVTPIPGCLRACNSSAIHDCQSNYRYDRVAKRIQESRTRDDEVLINCQIDLPSYGDNIPCSLLYSDTKQCMNEQLEIKQYYRSYTQQRSLNSAFVYPMQHASMGVTNNLIFQNVTSVSIIDEYLENNSICVIESDNNTEIAKCALFGGREDGDFSENDSFSDNIVFIKDYQGHEISDAAEIASSKDVQYFMTKNGLVYSTNFTNGSSAFGLLGVKKPNLGNQIECNSFSTCAPPVNQINLFNAISMSANLHSVCVTYKNNDIKFETKCWGSNLYGQTGYTNGEDYPWQWVVSNDNWNTILKDPLNYFTEPTVMGENFIFDNPKE